MTAPVRTRRGTPEADAQREIVHAMRQVLPRGCIVHHSANETRGDGVRARAAQAMLVGMGVYPGFSDLVVLAPERRVLFLEVKSKTGTQSAAQLDFHVEVQALGWPYEVVRTSNEAIGALLRHGIPTLIRSGW